MTTDIERRLSILEKAVGIDLDSTNACGGDPENCTAQPCDVSRCPLMNNLVHQAYKLATDREHDYVVLRYLVEELMKKGKVPQELLSIAEKKAMVAAITRRTLQIQETLRATHKDSSLHDSFRILLNENHVRVEKLEAEIEEIEAKLEC